MIMECDIFFMFCVTNFLVLYFMDTYLATWLVASTRSMFQRMLVVEKALQTVFRAPDARKDVLVQHQYLWM